MTPLIRKMFPSDAQQVHALGGNIEEFRTVPGSSNCFWPIETLEAIAEKEIAYVVEDHEKIVGFLIATYQPTTHKLTWENIYIQPKYRGKGIFNQCWTHAEKEARTRGATYVCGLVEENNIQSQKMLEKEGFTKGKKYIWTEKVL